MTAGDFCGEVPPSVSGRREIDALLRLHRRQRELVLEEAALIRAAFDAAGEAETLGAVRLSRSNMYARMRLLRLSPVCREALLDGRLLLDVARDIADFAHAEQDRLMRAVEGMSAVEGLKVVRARRP